MKILLPLALLLSLSAEADIRQRPPVPARPIILQTEAISQRPEQPSGGPPPAAGPTHYYALNDTPGDGNTWVDTGSGTTMNLLQTGTSVGSADGVDGVTQHAASFPGVNYNYLYKIVGDPGVCPTTDSFTVAFFYVYQTGTGSTQYLVGEGTSSTSPGSFRWAFTIVNGFSQARFYYSTGSSTSFKSIVHSFTGGEWWLVSVHRDGTAGTWIAYIGKGTPGNEYDTGEFTVALNPAPKNFFIGQVPATTTTKAHSDIDNVAVWHSLKTRAEVIAYMGTVP